MSKCEACGGDGQIEYGAYRGDEAGPTRECRLCGGVITQTAPLETLGVSAQSASGGLQRLAHVVSESGRRFTDLVITTHKPPHHMHDWKERVFTDVVEYQCDFCKSIAICSRRDGSLVNPAGVSEVDALLLSSRTMVKFPYYVKSRTSEELAAERLEQLRQDNERKQAEAELLEARRFKIESELRLLETQRDTYIAKGTENIANKYEQDLRRELQRDTNDTMNDLIRSSML